jgi:muramidase (phage lysozyme)
MPETKFALSQISRTVDNISTRTGEFKAAANDNSRNISNVIKDVSNIFQFQRKNFANVNNTIQNITDNIDKNAAETNRTNVLINESLAIQSDMLSEIKNMRVELKELGLVVSTLSAAGGGGGPDISVGGPNTQSNLLRNSLLGGAAIAAGGAALYNMNVGDTNVVGGGSENFSGGGVTNKDLPPEAEAFLNSLTARGYEGTDSYPNRGYNTIVGGKQFQGFEKHPGITGVVTAAGPSTAAGRYQFTKTTWDEISKRYGITDFSPENQDIAAWFLAQERYKKSTGGDLLTALQSNDPKVLATVEIALSGTWSSLKGGVHEGSSAGKFSTFYLQNLKEIQSTTQSVDGVTPQQGVTRSVVEESVFNTAAPTPQSAPAGNTRSITPDANLVSAPGAMGSDSTPQQNNQIPNNQQQLSYVAPVTGTFIGGPGSYFHAPRSGGTRLHSGGDWQAANGSNAVFPIGGQVLYSGRHSGYEHMVDILGDDGKIHRLAPHGSVGNFRVGSRVEAGDYMGKIGQGHLHYEVIPENSPVYSKMVEGGKFVSTSQYAGRPNVSEDLEKVFGLERKTRVTAGEPIESRSPISRGLMGEEERRTVSPTNRPTSNQDLNIRNDIFGSTDMNPGLLFETVGSIIGGPAIGQIGRLFGDILSNIGDMGMGSPTAPIPTPMPDGRNIVPTLETMTPANRDAGAAEPPINIVNNNNMSGNIPDNKKDVFPNWARSIAGYANGRPGNFLDMAFDDYRTRGL